LVTVFTSRLSAVFVPRSAMTFMVNSWVLHGLAAGECKRAAQQPDRPALAAVQSLSPGPATSSARAIASYDLVTRSSADILRGTPQSFNAALHCLRDSGNAERWRST
jgi:hypothetical protein